ncbi:MAG: cytochrome P450 [Myxococcota bacterium]
MPVDFDPISPTWRDDPYPRYRELRDRAPLHQSPDTGFWFVSRYEDVLAVLRDHDTFSSGAMMTQLMLGGEKKPPVTPRSLWFAARLLWTSRINPFELPRVPSLIASDGERHAGLRAIVNRGFTPRRITAWEARAREIVRDCLASASAGELDVVRDLAVPLPVTIIAEMLGIEPDRRHDFKRWSDIIVNNASGAGRADPFGPVVLDAFAEMTRYVVTISRERRAAPADDLISQLVTGGGEGGALSPIEVVQFVGLLLVAGNETTTNLIGNASAALLAHPDQLARVADDPGLVPGLVEETVRFDAPVQLVFRDALRDVEIAGGRLPAGSTVVALIGSANRDERRFPEPDRFDVGRNPVGHLGFGFGKHFCLGASLARLQARVALEALIPELVRRDCPEPRPPRIDSFLVRGPSRLPLRRAA